MDGMRIGSRMRRKETKALSVGSEVMMIPSLPCLHLSFTITPHLLPFVPDHYVYFFIQESNSFLPIQGEGQGLHRCSVPTSARLPCTPCRSLQTLSSHHRSGTDTPPTRPHRPWNTVASHGFSHVKQTCYIVENVENSAFRQPAKLLCGA